MVDKKPRTFVCVAGAGHGGWAWAKVRNILTAQGHRVFTPTLTGLADRSHLLSADIDLDMHITDVANLFSWEDLEDVVLVGHSYGGWVISGVAERVLSQLSGIVYVDAFLPKNGQRGYDFTNAAQQAAIDEAKARGDLSRPGPNGTSLKIQRPEDVLWANSKLTAQPLGVSLQPIVLTGARDKVPHKLYIRTPEFAQPTFDAALAECEVDPSWQTLVMTQCGHDPMIDKPEELANILTEFA